MKKTMLAALVELPVLRSIGLRLVRACVKVLAVKVKQILFKKRLTVAGGFELIDTLF
jgi:hypothetical protein